MNILKSVVVVMFTVVFSANVFSNDNQVVLDEEFFYTQKQIHYQKLRSKFPLATNQSNISSNDASDDVVKYKFIVDPNTHVEVTISLKEPMLDERFIGKGGADIQEEFPVEYERFFRNLMGVMAELPAHSYVNFAYIKNFMSIETRVTKEGLDYLNSLDDVFINEFLRVKFF